MPAMHVASACSASVERPSYHRLVSEVAFLVGREVVELQANPDGSTRIVFELGDQPALYADVGESICTDADGSSRMLASVKGGAVARTSTEGGTLTLVFADGSRLRCEPDPRFEAWQVVGGTPQHLVVCMPGGELAVWDSSHVPSAAEAQEVVASLKESTRRDLHVREITETGGIMSGGGDMPPAGRAARRP